VTSLQLAGSLIDPEASPFLWLLLVHPFYNMMLVVAIAVGVGFASVLGTKDDSYNDSYNDS